MKRVVVTSTAGILGPSEKEPVHESSPVPESFFTLYEASKFRMEQELLSLAHALPEIVIVNPTRVFGPGLLSESNSMTKMIARYIQGRWRLLPGDGNSMGNYVFVEDVVRNVAVQLQGDPRVRWFRVHTENHESIHNHSAFAEVSWTRG